MGEAFFYHLTRKPMEETLAMLLAKSLERGWRVAVRGTDSDRLARLDRQLWLGDEAGFLPHGMAGGPHDSRQPVLLTTGLEAANAPHCVIAIHGADIGPEETAALDRCCLLFEDTNTAAMTHARDQWRGLKAAGCSAQYWSDESGGWQMKAKT